ncbi:hypothetical protein [Sphingomonas elodea]|uniref:hypothetical protein n=1 Tax=Sphingomonas elodea TaxID=179878 RepID=UPI0002630300|nr:hypothetical protein [Sphingomonas elodea]
MNPIRLATPAVPLAALLLAACSGTVPPARPAAPLPVPGRVPVPEQPANLAPIRGLNATQLLARFGQPRLDVTEGKGRKLQFVGPICVLDAYLYPPESGSGTATVTWVDARQRNGSPLDQASCVAALTKRK